MKIHERKITRTIRFYVCDIREDDPADDEKVIKAKKAVYGYEIPEGKEREYLTAILNATNPAFLKLVSFEIIDKPIPRTERQFIGDIDINTLTADAVADDANK